MKIAGHRDGLDCPVRQHVRPVQTTLRGDQTIGEALASLRGRQIDQQIVYFYVLDPDDKLVGVIPTRRLLLAELDQKVSQVMHAPVVSVPATQTLGEALTLFARHQYLALPVVDDQQRLLGAIDVRLYAEEAWESAELERANDLFQFIGLKVDQVRQGSPLAGYRVRMPWLLCNVFSGIVCAAIALFFEDVLQQVVMLAMFFPLVLTLSESISMQSMTISLQMLHRTHTPWRMVKRRVNLEWKTAAMLGLSGGLLVAAASLLWSFSGHGHSEPLQAGFVLLASILCSMLLSAMLGVGLPVSLHAAKLDPKVASGPVVLMVADILTTFVYLGVATWKLV